jgi:hypothetical protein
MGECTVRIVVECLALAWLIFLAFGSSSIALGQNVEHVKLYSAEVVASSSVVDVRDNLTLQTLITLVGKC